MNSVAQDRKFLHTLTLTSPDSILPRYLIAGDEWYGSNNGGHHDSLTLHPANGVILQIKRAHTGDGFMWEWSLKLADGVYVSHGAAADSVEAAAAAAIAYVPRELIFDYLTETTWYETADGRFTAMLDGEVAKVCKSVGSDGYHWERLWAPAKEINEAVRSFGYGELSGTAPTPEAAMIACIEAPNRLKTACATLIASLREPLTGAMNRDPE